MWRVRGRQRPDLRERHLGDLQGMSRREASNTNPTAYRAMDRGQEIPGGGESLDQLSQRCTSALQRIGMKHLGSSSNIDPVLSVLFFFLEYALVEIKRLATFDKIFSAYREARGYIRADLSTAGSAENVKDELYGLDKAVSTALGERTTERNLLLVKVAKSKLADENNEKVTKPEELVRLYDLLLQNTADLSEDCASKTLAFRAERCFYVAKSYSMSEKRAEAYALYCRARDLAEDALRKLKTLNGNNQTMMKDLEGLCNECRSNSCIEHGSNMSWTVDEQLEKFLTEKLDVYESAVAGGGESLDDQLSERCTSALQRIGMKHLGKLVVVVSH
ncbi:hypothetical protein K1719_015394 [Acacia pycnantha]|nr:hypothetical protein K1719_015394 [Acacia pycnantha]